MKMCARFQFAPPEDWVEEFGLTGAPEVAPRYNIAPTQDVLAVRRRRTGDRQARLFRWGLVPYWAEDPDGEPPDQRARGERGHAAGLPRAVPAAALPRARPGFYEWKKFGRAREPWLIRLKGGATFAFAGSGTAGRAAKAAIESCALITTSANALVAPIHGACRC
jgi:putative SOS response-associated peptidase YedK